MIYNGTNIQNRINKYTRNWLHFIDCKVDVSSNSAIKNDYKFNIIYELHLEYKVLIRFRSKNQKGNLFNLFSKSEVEK